MESTNLHHLQNQNHSSSSSSSSALHASSSSSSSYFGVASGTTTNITLNGDYKLKQNLQDTNYRSPRSRSANSMIEAGLGYNNNSNNSNNNNNEWASSTTNTGSCLSSESCEDGHDHYHLDLHHHHHHHQYNNNNYNSKMKEEISDNINVVGFPTKFTEMLNTTSTMDQKDFNALSDKLLYSAITSPNFSSSGVCGGMGNLGIIRGGSFTQIHPTVNISSFTQTTSSSSLPSFNDINNNMQCSLSESSDLFHGGLVITNHQDNHNHNHNHNHDADLFHPRFADSLSFRRLQHMQMQQQQQPIHTSSCIVSNSTNNPISEFTNGMVAEAKRPINTTLVESKASHQSQTVPKKSRLESRSSSSCPPFKVRKEKLGDRIAALQQLVAPFGKTDTASVLMEAIGYIKFLQNQVETLSVPYMKSSRKQNNRAMQGVSEGKQEEGKVDLRSRGLCLVPLSCMSYFTSDGGTGLMWQHSDHFGGPT